MTPSWHKKLSIWIRLNRSTFFIIAVCLSILIGAVWGISTLESYPRTQLLAQTPIYLLKQTVGTFLWVFIIIKFLQGGDSGFFSKNAFQSQKVDVHFSDVVGADEIKNEARDIVMLLKGEGRLSEVGARLIRGVLMIGPPGCGKTFLAKAIATEAGIPFISTSGSEMTDVYVGVGASKIRDIFKQSRLLAKEFGACILFIDEIDTIGKKRSFGFNSDQETNKTLNQLLVEMDGMAKEKQNVTVIAATNAPENTLDPALLRAGRFDRKLYYDLPTRKEREDLFAHFLGQRHWDQKGIQIPFWAGITSYRSPADIENIVDEAELISIRNTHEFITVQDMSEALERIELGLKRKRKVADEEKESTAYHEAGHLVAIHFLSPDETYFKISVVFRKETLGAVHTFAREESYFKDRDDFLGKIQGLLGGYVAEKIKYNATSSGVSSDFSRAMQLAHTMVFKHGMGKSGHIGDYTAMPRSMMSENLKKELNEDVEDILRYCLKTSENLLRQKWDLIKIIVENLKQKEELELMEIKKILDDYESRQTK